MSTLIIEVPHQQGKLRRFIQGSITLVLWALWVYLLLPLFTLVMTLAGIEFPVFISTKSPIHFNLFFAILVFVGATILGMLLWARYNTSLHRRRTNRHDPATIVCPNDLASYFSVPPKDLAGWHRSGQLTIQLTKQGDIHRVAVSKPFEPRNRS